jgi:uncharacterized membrane protein YheB (UPF0754 family)
MTNPVTPFRNNLFGSRPTIQEALDYAEVMINNLSAPDQVALRTAFGVLLNTIDNKVTNTPERIAVTHLIASMIGEQLNVTMNDVDEQVSNWMDSHLYDRLDAHKVVREDDIGDHVDAHIHNLDDKIADWMDNNLRDKVMSIVEDDDISDQISNWMSNNFDIEDYNVGDAIESWADRNLEDKIQETINNLTFTVNVN